MKLASILNSNDKLKESDDSEEFGYENHVLDMLKKDFAGKVEVKKEVKFSAKSVEGTDDVDGGDLTIELDNDDTIELTWEYSTGYSSEGAIKNFSMEVNGQRVSCDPERNGKGDAADMRILTAVEAAYKEHIQENLADYLE